PDIDRFTKWTGMLDRWDRERTAAALCTQDRATECEPSQWRQTVERLKPLELKIKLATVNTLINRFPYRSSAANWSLPNYWETPFEFFRKSGQCQDYAITKFMLLREAGVSNDQMRIVVLRDTRLGEDHAVVVVYVEGRALMLDNQIPEVVPVDGVRHYRPYYSINETGWWRHETGPRETAQASLN
ncbi:MAG: transglutaminase-like cysteine peptidase, partial [Acidimicrobiales bacterium]